MLLYIILIFQDKPYNYYMDVKKELGLKIKRLRQKEGLTQEQFAEKLNIATRTLAGIEIGESFVSAQTIENILNYTNISFEDFFISSHLRPTEDLLNLQGHKSPFKRIKLLSFIKLYNAVIVRIIYILCNFVT